uniref:Homeobox domain-containing protein n=1 Tax=Anopheles farauti TaxID=69004 RepID=A0A182Q2P0_9DIPT
MDANNFVMSSYQFVNSIASCYPNSAQNTNSSPSTAGGQGGQNDGYFPPSAYAPNIYPGTPHQAHYSPQSYNPLASAGATSVNSAGAGPVGGGHQASDMVDYTQLQPQKFLLSQQQQQQQQSALNSQSCKYASDGSSAGTNVVNNNNNNNNSTTSPQDLSTASGGGGGSGGGGSAGANGGNGGRPEISPKLSPGSVVENVTRSLKSGNPSTAVSSSNTNNNTSNISNRNQVNLPLGSPEDDSDASDDDSGTEGGSSQGGGGSGGKKGGPPPHIYPWMKRVHIGQTELN